MRFAPERILRCRLVRRDFTIHLSLSKAGRLRARPVCWPLTRPLSTPPAGTLGRGLGGDGTSFSFWSYRALPVEFEYGYDSRPEIGAF